MVRMEEDKRKRCKYCEFSEVIDREFVFCKNCKKMRSCNGSCQEGKFCRDTDSCLSLTADYENNFMLKILDEIKTEGYIKILRCRDCKYFDRECNCTCPENPHKTTHSGYCDKAEKE